VVKAAAKPARGVKAAVSKAIAKVTGAKKAAPKKG